MQLLRSGVYGTVDHKIKQNNSVNVVDAEYHARMAAAYATGTILCTTGTPIGEAVGGVIIIGEGLVDLYDYFSSGGD